MSERRRKHDDVHRPLQGKGKRANPRAVTAAVRCPFCGMTGAHACAGAYEAARTGRWSGDKIAPPNYPRDIK